MLRNATFEFSRTPLKIYLVYVVIFLHKLITGSAFLGKLITSDLLSMLRCMCLQIG